MEKEESKDVSNEDNNKFYFEESVDVLNNNEILEGKVVSVRGQMIMVYLPKYQQEIRVNLSEGRLLKQWTPGKQFQLNNRVDIKDLDDNKWIEGIVTDINYKDDKVEITYTNHNKQVKSVWIYQNSYRLTKPGTYSLYESKQCQYDYKEVNKRLFGNKKMFKMSKEQETIFKKKMDEQNMLIYNIKGDGNCLFGSISHQIYGDQKYHPIIREKCMDYIQQEKEYFQQFIEGGKDCVDEYIEMKRTLGVWGDDIEIQAISEIYNRPIEIYTNSKEPLKTFHENNRNFSHYNNIVNNSYPIRISYHGSKHYNSIVPCKGHNEYQTYLNSLLKSIPGEYETKSILKMKEKKDIIIDQARINFEKKNNNIDDYLLKGENGKSNLDNEIVQSMLKKSEDDLLNEAIKQSLVNNNNNSNDNNYNNNPDNYLSIPAIQTALEYGFSLDDAIVAYTLYSDSIDLMLQYLFSMKSNHNNYI